MAVIQTNSARAKNPTGPGEVVQAVATLENLRKEPTFNSIFDILSDKGILAFHRSLRNYLDLLIAARVLRLKKEKTAQQNIRENRSITDGESR